MCKRIFANQTNLSFGIPFYKIGTLGSKCDSYISYDLFLEYKNKYKFPIKGETLITCSGTVGRCVKYDGNDAYYQDSNIVWLRGNNSPITNDFLYILLLNTNWTKLNSTTISRIYNNNLYSLQYNYPINIDVQNKIVDFFKKIDNRIETQKKIIRVLEDQMNSIKNKLFTKEYKSQTIHLSAILNEISNKSIINNQFPVISSTVKGLVLQSEYFDKEIASSNNIGYKIIEKGNIILSPQNLWMGNITFNNKFDKGIVSPSYKVFNIDSRYNKEYIYEILTTKKAFYLYKAVSEQGASIVRRNLNMEEFMQLSFKFPDINFQNKIMKYFSSFKNKLENEKKILSLYEKQKQYLLSKMFI